METNNPSKHPLTVARYLRHFRGLSMMALADKLQIPYLTVFSLEHGLGTNLNSLRRVAEYYHVSLDCLARNDLTGAAAQLTSRTIRSNRSKDVMRSKQRRNDTIGDLGERIVVERERKRLAGTPYELAVNGNASEDLSAGFDVLSFSETGIPIYIEVKSTVMGRDDDFFISRNELEFARKCKERGLNYQLHRVYALDEASGNCSVAVYSVDEILRSFEFLPVSYRVRRAAA